MRIQGLLTEEDLLAFQSRNVRLTRWAFFIGGPLLFLILLVALYRGPESLATLLFSLAPIVVLFVLGLFYFRSTLPRRVRKTFRSLGLEDPLEVEFTDETLNVSHPRINGHYPWTSFTNYVVTEDLTLLYDRKGTAHLLPRRWFTEEQYTEFLAILKARLGRPTGTN